MLNSRLPVIPSILANFLSLPYRLQPESASHSRDIEIGLEFDSDTSCSCHEHVDDLEFGVDLTKSEVDVLQQE